MKHLTSGECMAVTGGALSIGKLGTFLTQEAAALRQLEVAMGKGTGTSGKKPSGGGGKKPSSGGATPSPSPSPAPAPAPSGGGSGPGGLILFN